MKRLSLLTALLVVLAVPVRADPPDLVPPPHNADEAAWVQFGENLVVALKSDNEGLKISALQHIAAFGERFDVSDARFEMVRLFRDNKDERVRMMALAALSKANDAWIGDFLYRSARYESDAHMASLMYHAAVANGHG
jgi:hypothetical protein